MKIRSITVFTPLNWPFDEGTIAGVSRFLADARLRLNKSGFEVQTVRLATPPFMDVIGDPDVSVLIEYAQRLEYLATKHNIDFVSIGPVVATTPLALLMSIYALPRLIMETERIFSGVLFADNNSGINLAAAQAFAKTVHKVAQSTPQGFGNLRLAALANVPPNVPFFPAAYHDGGRYSFAIATEAADVALNTVENVRSLNEARRRLIAVIEGTSLHILEIVDELVDDHQIRFEGLDFSLAPYPNDEVSIAATMEKLGLDSFGGHGTVFTTAFLTSCIKQAEIPHTGFSGVMLPILEDSVLAQRVIDGNLSVNDLLLYSAVCGTGLDTVPIPGDTSPDDMAALFLDMAALAVTLNKPLTARLMPIPGLKAGDKVEIDFEFFANSQVMPIKNMGARSLIDKSSFLSMVPHKSGY
ncbi:DUF711 family protein [Anaerolineales bacterium HSG6]|nr:DUF711 family protein [Anaerolineales bacterium HSG6]MDM8531989.1 DUF711 family protein [Anaerolineales bacterium HSG25]